jgi:hypothetical protein
MVIFHSYVKLPEGITLVINNDKHPPSCHLVSPLEWCVELHFWLWRHSHSSCDFVQCMSFLQLAQTGPKASLWRIHQTSKTAAVTLRSGTCMESKIIWSAGVQNSGAPQAWASNQIILAPSWFGGPHGSPIFIHFRPNLDHPRSFQPHL